jgi:hypothetical protein
MDPKWWMPIFACFAVVFFVATLARVFCLDRQVVHLPCDDESFAGNVVLPDAKPSLVANFFPDDKIGLGSPLCVAIKGPANVAIDKDGKPTLHLFIDGFELKGAVGALVDRKKNLVQFDVSRSPNDTEVWSKIIAQLEWGKWGARAPLHVGVGTDKDGEFENANADQKPLELMMVDFWSLILGFGSFLAAVFALVRAAKTSAILRDGDDKSTYSLARVQMAFWLYLITAAFVFIWLVTGDYNGVLTTQSLTLIGISGTTALMAISAEKPAVAAVPAAPGVPAVPAVRAVPAASEGFLNDILNENGGVALHRLQIAVWTLILGVVFFAEIYHSFRLPAFDTNLLILMGISGTTYVGFKFQEK